MLRVVSMPSVCTWGEALLLTKETHYAELLLTDFSFHFSDTWPVVSENTTLVENTNLNIAQ